MKHSPESRLRKFSELRKYTKLTELQWTVLRNIAELTMILKGPNRGKVKDRRDAYGWLDGRVVGTLERRGLIEFEFNTIHGAGHALTPEGMRALDGGHR